MKKKNKKSNALRMICACALLCAAAVSIAYICKFMTFGSIRVTFENLPIILAGIFFGPVAGFATGVCADLVSTAVSFYGLAGINPIITAGAGAVGFFSGLMFRLPAFKKVPLKAAAAVLCAHSVGNMIIKSIGLMVYYSYSVPMVLPRIPLYLVIGAVEYIIILILIKNRGINKAVEKLQKP